MADKTSLRYPWSKGSRTYSKTLCKAFIRPNSNRKAPVRENLQRVPLKRRMGQITASERTITKSLVTLAGKRDDIVSVFYGKDRRMLIL